MLEMGRILSWASSLQCSRAAMKVNCCCWKSLYFCSTLRRDSFTSFIVIRPVIHGRGGSTGRKRRVRGSRGQTPPLDAALGWGGAHRPSQWCTGPNGPLTPLGSRDFTPILQGRKWGPRRHLLEKRAGCLSATEPSPSQVHKCHVPRIQSLPRNLTSVPPVQTGLQIVGLSHTHTHTNTVLIFKKCEKDKLADVKGTKVSLAYFFYQLVNSSFIL